MDKNNKFYFKCRKCGHQLNSFKDWFLARQQCPDCGNRWVDVHYYKDINEIKPLIEQKCVNADSFFHYFDFLPLLDRKNVISFGEGVIPVNQWEWLEDFAKIKYGIECKVFAYRNDENQGTGTFKDVAGAMAASILKENGVTDYVVASTGNIANAFAFYLAQANINLSVFIPQDALKANEAEVNSYGQRIFRVNGDYAKAKKIAAEFSQKYNFLISAGNIDPIRVEGKKTMAFEWLRLMGDLPSVYIQALSGGTGPIAIEKAIKDLEPTGLVKTKPRHLLIQPHQCAPMAHAYAKAKAANFPEGWETEYPIYDNPITLVPTLATGNPATYPIISKIVHDSHGDIIEFNEFKMADVARLVAYETSIRIGPASAIAVGGFFEALGKNLIKNGDRVMINIGEGVRRSPEFMEEMIYTTIPVNDVNECTPPKRSEFKKIVWDKFLK